MIGQSPNKNGLHCAQVNKCTPPSTVETFGEEISAEACSGKEIAGLLRKIRMMNMMTRKS